MIERIAQRVRHGSRPGEEFFVGRRVAGRILLAHSIGPHGTPFVVVAFQPDFEQILKAAVGSHVLGRQMAMIVEDGLIFRVLMIKPLRGPGMQQKIFVDK